MIKNDNHSVIEFCEKLYKIDEHNSFAIKKLAEFYQSHGENNVSEKNNVTYFRICVYCMGNFMY